MTPLSSDSVANRRSGPEAVRITRRTLGIVASVYVGIGFAVAAPAALRGDPLSAFLGFVIISGALAGAVALNALLRLNVCLTEMGEAIDDVRDRLRRIERASLAVNTSEATGPGSQSTAIIDLATLGVGDPSVLTAATLDRNVFPRLASSVDEAPPLSPGEVDVARDHTPAEAVTDENSLNPPAESESPSADVPAGLTTRNLLRSWKVALRERDLQTCRSIYSTLVDIVEPQRLASLKELLQDLTERTEQSLRKTFSESIDRRDYSGALRVGEQICTHLPDHRIAADFHQIRPRLNRLLQEQASSPNPDLAIAP